MFSTGSIWSVSPSIEMQITWLTKQPARVTAHTVGTDQFPQRTVILIKLDPSVMDREAVLGK